MSQESGRIIFAGCYLDEMDATEMREALASIVKHGYKQPVQATIVLGTPSMGSSVDDFAETVFRMAHGAKGFNVIPVRCEGSAIAHNQNNIVAAARKVDRDLRSVGAAGVDAVFFVENDESFMEAETVIPRLWGHNKDVVGATYAYKYPDRIRAMGVELDGEPIDWLSLYHRPDLSEVAALPIGALMVRMNVFDAMDEQEVPALDPAGRPTIVKQWPTFYHDVHFSLRLVRTTDYVFSCRARDIGFKVWLDAPLSLTIRHWGKYPYALPHSAKVNRQLATLQAVADAHAKESEKPGAAPHYADMAEDLYAVAADLQRRMGVFGFTEGEPRIDDPARDRVT